MSHPAPHVDDEGPFYKPQPRQRRQFDLSSAPNSAPPTPPLDFGASIKDGLQQINTSVAESKPIGMNDESATPLRTRSFLNLTGSTLFGIYQPAGMGTETENPTPWGTGAQTPADYGSRNGSFDFSRASHFPDNAFQKHANGSVTRRPTAPQIQKHRMPRKGFKGIFLPFAARVTTLFGMGVLYGLLIGHLHDRQQIAPVKVDLDRTKWSYLATWGCIGALLGEALPWADVLWAPDIDSEEEGRSKKTGKILEGWIYVVRSIGAFIGIAFAIRKLPWQSTLQLSLTLALANPALWYLIDRSPPGFIMSTIVAISGTAIFLGINPALIPSPSPWQMLQHQQHAGINDTFNMPSNDELVLGIFSQESVGIATWIASVLFVSSVCFGNIGRRLAPQRP